MVPCNKLRLTKSKLVKRLNYQSNLIEKLINDGGEIQITDASLLLYKRLKINDERANTFNNPCINYYL